MFLFSKIFMTIWFGFAMFWTIAATAMAIGVFFFQLDPDANSLVALFPFFGVAFIFVGVGFVRFFWRFSLGDIGYLTDVIEDALQSD